MQLAGTLLVVVRGEGNRKVESYCRWKEKRRFPAQQAWLGLSVARASDEEERKKGSTGVEISLLTRSVKERRTRRNQAQEGN
jgi:hypothetical protein